MKLEIKHLWLWVTAMVVAAGALVLYLFPPGSAWFYPRCAFHQMTGLDCPGCGGLRAAHQLLHGHFKEALALNPMLVLLAPVFAVMTVYYVWQGVTGRTLSHPFKHPAWLWTLLGVALAFGILRNLPIFRFASIGP